jgi:hypothetical protein
MQREGRRAEAEPGGEICDASAEPRGKAGSQRGWRAPLGRGRGERCGGTTDNVGCQAQEDPCGSTGLRDIVHMAGGSFWQGARLVGCALRWLPSGRPTPGGVTPAGAGRGPAQVGLTPRPGRSGTGSSGAYPPLRPVGDRVTWGLPPKGVQETVPLLPESLGVSEAFRGVVAAFIDWTSPLRVVGGCCPPSLDGEACWGRQHQS